MRQDAGRSNYRGLPAGSGRVLTLHARALFLFLETTGLLHDQHPVEITQMVDHIGAQVIKYLLVVSCCTGLQMLHAVWRPISSFAANCQPFL
jgi:hypothetical protein